jgi:hypothetical protein
VCFPAECATHHTRQAAPASTIYAVPTGGIASDRGRVSGCKNTQSMPGRSTRSSAKAEAPAPAAPAPKKADAPEFVAPDFNKLDKWALPPVAGSWYPGKGDYTQLDKDALPPCAGKRSDDEGNWL